MVVVILNLDSLIMQDNVKALAPHVDNLVACNDDFVPDVIEVRRRGASRECRSRGADAVCAHARCVRARTAH